MNERFVLIGAVAAGKTTLLNALLGKAEAARKTQAVEYEGGVVDTPGEFFSHPRLYHALINTAAEIGTLVYVHASDDDEFRMPPGLLDVNSGKRLVGVITKTDLPGADPERTESLLSSHGFHGRIFHVSSRRPESIERLKSYLEQDFEPETAGVTTT